MSELVCLFRIQLPNALIRTFAGEVLDVKASFEPKFFKFRQKLIQISVFKENGAKCVILFLGPPKDTFVQETTPCDVY